MNPTDPPLPPFPFALDHQNTLSTVAAFRERLVVLRHHSNGDHVERTDAEEAFDRAARTLDELEVLARRSFFRPDYFIYMTLLDIRRDTMLDFMPDDDLAYTYLQLGRELNLWDKPDRTSEIGRLYDALARFFPVVSAGDDMAASDKSSASEAGGATEQKKADVSASASRIKLLRSLEKMERRHARLLLRQLSLIRDQNLAKSLARLYEIKATISAGTTGVSAALVALMFIYANCGATMFEGYQGVLTGAAAGLAGAGLSMRSRPADVRGSQGMPLITETYGRLLVGVATGALSALLVVKGVINIAKSEAMLLICLASAFSERILYSSLSRVAETAENSVARNYGLKSDKEK